MSLMGGPRQLFFQAGAEMPKVCTPCEKLMSIGWGEVSSSELTWPVPRLCAHFNLFAIKKYFYDSL